MKIPFLSFKKMNADVKKETLASFEKFFESQWYILGENVKNFEKDYAAFNHTKYCVGVANGLDALIISLKTLGIGKDDEVIVPSNTYIATWLAVSAVGAIPVPVEPKIGIYNIDPSLIEKKITNQTKAIIPVHLFGQCCEMDEVISLAKKNNLFVVEDNAQSQGASYNGKFAGSFGNINATSFYPGKNLGAYGDAGAITTDDESLVLKASVIRNYGSEKKYYNEIQGMNSRLDEVQAGFLSVKLTYLNSWNNERAKIASMYSERLKNIGRIILPQIASSATSVFHQFVIRTKKRDDLQKFLNKNGVETLIHYPVPPHLQKAYSELNFKKGDFPIAEEIADTCLSLPIYRGLTESEIDYVCETIKKFSDA